MNGPTIYLICMATVMIVMFGLSYYFHRKQKPKQ